jgi:hypothetical protein
VEVFWHSAHFLYFLVAEEFGILEVVEEWKSCEWCRKGSRVSRQFGSLIVAGLLTSRGYGL